VNPGTPNQNGEPGTLNPEPERDTRMTSTYIQVLVLEAIIIAALWVFGRMFS
jgi:hypothetical protein